LPLSIAEACEKSNPQQRARLAWKLTSLIVSGETMPTGPKGEKRPADAIARAVKVMRILTGEEPEEFDRSSPAAKSRAKKGGETRAASLEKTERSEIARKAAAARWQKK
jgi:hypothetical protein